MMRGGRVNLRISAVACAKLPAKAAHVLPTRKTIASFAAKPRMGAGKLTRGQKGMHRRSRDGLAVAAMRRRRVEQRVLRAATLAFCVAGLGLAATASGAAASGEPFFKQCPPIGLDSGCAYLIEVTSTNPEVAPLVIHDPNQPFYDREDDITVGVVNDTSAPLAKVHIGARASGDRLFAFDGDGICW